MARPVAEKDESLGLDQLARQWLTRTPARRYFRRLASKSRRAALKRSFLLRGE